MLQDQIITASDREWIEPGLPSDGLALADAESERIEALLSYRLLDTPPEPEFNAIVQLAGSICDTPVALVSLVQTDRQWFKAKLGFDGCETPIGQSVCAYALNEPEILVIPDLTVDARTQGNTLVTQSPHIRFYAGAVLRSAEGHALGALCVIDGRPRPGGLTVDQRRNLILLARQAMTLIELRKAVGVRDGVLADHHRAATTVTERLRAAEGRLRSAQSAARIGAFEIDVAAYRVHATEEFARIFGLVRAASYDAGAVLQTVLPEDRFLAASRETLTDGSAEPSVEYRIRRPSDGAVRWILRRGAVELDEAGRPLRMVGVVEDITERKLADVRTTALLALGDRLRDAETRAAALAAAARLLGQTLDAAHAGYALIDPVARLFVIEGSWAEPGLPVLDGQYLFDLFPQTVERLARGEPVVVANVAAADWLRRDQAAYGAIGAAAVIHIPLLERRALVGALFVYGAQPRTWTPEETTFAAALADRTYAAAAKLQAQAEQSLLNLELSHRIKNTMAMVQSIAQQTLTGAAGAEALRDFDSRLSALGRAHEVLLHQSWVAARIRTVIDAALSLHGRLDRFDVDGPELNLNAKAALGLALLLHELGTNAVKHGALSNDAGRVCLKWSLLGQGVGAQLQMTWAETGGPPVAAPSRRGFGSRLIGIGLGGTQAAQISYHMSGLVAVFSAPLLRIIEV